MQIVNLIINKISSLTAWFLKRSLVVKIIIIGLILGSFWLAYSKIKNQKNQEIQYQTTQVERGTLIVSVTSSGQVSTANNASVTSNSSGIVNKVFVQNGDQVETGDPIVEIDLDRQSQQQYSQAMASYQSAKNSLESAKAQQLVFQATMFGNWDEFKSLAESSTYTNPDGSPNYNNRALPQFHISEKNWLASEMDYKNQQNVIIQAQTSLTSAWLSLQESSSVIYSPISGIITGLSLQLGSVIASSATVDSTTGQKIASVVTTTNPQVSINLSEIDIPKVKIGNKATVTFDAYSGKTYTGKIISIDTMGTTNSGVTSYPTVIVLDSQNPEILTNMAASVSIIAETKDNVLLVPSSTVQSQNGESFVRLLKNGEVSQVTVTTGLSSDSQTEIVSGIIEGDIVISSNISTSTQTQNSAQSPFSPLGRSGFGANVRIR